MPANRDPLANDKPELREFVRMMAEEDARISKRRQNAALTGLAVGLPAAMVWGRGMKPRAKTKQLDKFVNAVSKELKSGKTSQAKVPDWMKPILAYFEVRRPGTSKAISETKLERKSISGMDKALAEFRPFETTPGRSIPTGPVGVTRLYPHLYDARQRTEIGRTPFDVATALGHERIHAGQTLSGGTKYMKQPGPRAEQIRQVPRAKRRGSADLAFAPEEFLSYRNRPSEKAAFPAGEREKEQFIEFLATANSRFPGNPQQAGQYDAWRAWRKAAEGAKDYPGEKKLSETLKLFLEAAK